MALIDELCSAIHECEDGFAAQEYFFQRGWTDGLPVVPPTPERVAEFLEAAGRTPDETVAVVPTRRRRITAEKVAINAVMAGCRPEYLPVVLAILEAMAEPAFNFHGSITSTGGSAQLVVVNGPVCRRLGLNCGVNLFGPGNRANATIGRAVRLVLLNVCGAVPGVLDQSTQGHGGKYSMVIGEDEEHSPWPPLHVERGFDPAVSTVTVFAAEAPHNVQDHVSTTGEGVLTAIAMEMASGGSWSNGQSAVIISPEHRRLLHGGQWTRRRVQEFLYEHAVRSAAELKRAGKLLGPIEPGDEQRQHHRGMGPEDILLVAAGGEAGGHSSFIPSWSRGRYSLFVTRAIREPAEGTLP
jgi:hypothetical protein